MCDIGCICANDQYTVFLCMYMCKCANDACILANDQYTMYLCMHMCECVHVYVRMCACTCANDIQMIQMRMLYKRHTRA